MRKLQIVILLMCLFLTSCAKASISVDNSNSVSTPNSLHETTQSSTEHQSKNIQYINNCSLGITDIGYYYVKARNDIGQNIMYLDFETGQSVVVCSNISCLHNDETCSSWISTSYNTPRIIPTESTLILIYPGNAYNYEINSKDIFPHVDTMDFNGANKTQIVQYNSNIMFTDFFAIDNNILYCQLDVYDKETGTKTADIQQIDLTARTSSTLTKIDSNAVFMLGSNNENLYYKKIIADTSLNEPMEMIANQQHKIFEFDTNNLTQTEILSWKQDSLNEYYTKEGIYTISDTYDLKMFSFETDTQKELPVTTTLKNHLQNLGDNLSFQLLYANERYILAKATSIGSTPSETKDTMFCIDMVQNTVKDITATTNRGGMNLSLEIQAIKNDNIVAVDRYETVNSSFISEDGSVYPIEIVEPIYKVYSFDELF